MMDTNTVAVCASLRRGLSIAAVVALAGIGAVLPDAANAAGTGAEAGRKIFQQNCIACHTVGKGDLVGPDLKGVTAKQSREWLQHWIAAPDEMLANKDPIATGLLHQFHDVPMPNLHLSASDVTAVLDYLETTAPGASAQPSALAPVGQAGATTSAASAPAIAGDPSIGEQFFTGTRRFGAGGPPCMACHSVGGIGALGGGQLGPDLTTVVTRYGGAAAVSAFVGGSPTPTMNAVWSRTPLTADERADVVAFLAQAAVNRRPTQEVWQLAGLAVLGLVILFAIAGGVWRGRQRDGVRRPMIAKQRRARG